MRAKRKCKDIKGKRVWLWVPRAEKLRNALRPSTKPPLSPEKAAFGLEVRELRIRQLKNIPQLATELGITKNLLRKIEKGLAEDPKLSASKLKREQIRIWVETNKPLNQRRKEQQGFDPFADIEQLLKEKEHGGEITERPSGGL